MVVFGIPPEIFVGHPAVGFRRMKIPARFPGRGELARVPGRHQVRFRRFAGGLKIDKVTLNALQLAGRRSDNPKRAPCWLEATIGMPDNCKKIG
jgi:hypothetical protein